MNEYALLDSGNGAKWERFGAYTLIRPAAQAVWLPTRSWESADARFEREEGSRVTMQGSLPDEWTVTVENLRFRLAPTSFGHLGLFPEQIEQWIWLREQLTRWDRPDPPQLLNLFAYSGGISLVAAQAGAAVTHLDASKGMVEWASHNAASNHISSVRWIVDDAMRFLAREHRRGRRYDAIVLDPPTFGRGSQGEVFKIERDVVSLLEACQDLLADDPLLVLLTSHTPTHSPLVLHHLLQQMMQEKQGAVTYGEMTLQGAADVLPLPNGAYARWHRAH